MSNRITGERQETATQDVVEGCERFPQWVECLRLKVATAIMGALDVPICAADAAILAILEELSEFDLPEEAAQAADDAPVFYDNGLAGIYEPEFRAILAVLQSMISKEAK